MTNGPVPDIGQCPKCAAAFPEPLAETAACPSCGVYFFKLATTPAPGIEAVTERPVPSTPSRRWRYGVFVLVILAGLGVWRGVHRQAPPDMVKVVSAPAPVATGTATADPTRVTVERNPRASAPPADIDPEILQLHQSRDVVFDMREEVYRIANLNSIALESIQFHGNTVDARSGDGTPLAAVAFAQPSLRDGQRICDVRVIRPTDDITYQPGQATTQLTNMIRRTTIAHELSHCVDWYHGGRGWTQYGPSLPPPREGLSAEDQWRRWREEFADLHAMVLLKRALGDDAARLAMKVRALERKTNPVTWYRHAYVPLHSGEALQSTTPEDTERLIAKYWGQ